MTKQDGFIAKVGPIKIGGGHRSGSPKKFAYPPERLAEFLNVDVNKITKIKEYCNKYSLLPPKMYSVGLGEAFKEEQQKLLRVYRNYKNNGSLNEEDLDVANSYLELTKPKILETTSKDLGKLGKYINAKTDLPENNERYLLKIFKSNSISTLWEDFVNQVLKKQKLSECINCGRFYLLESGHERKFCSEECGDAHRKRKTRAEKKT